MEQFGHKLITIESVLSIHGGEIVVVSVLLYVFEIFP